MLMKKVALKLRFEELEDFKRERDEASQAEKYRIIEKHINLDRTAQRKYPPYIIKFPANFLMLISFYSEEIAT